MSNPEPYVVDLRLSADLARLFLVRSMVASIAIRADFDVDTIEDLKLVVDEMCATLVVRARPDTDLCCRFEVAHRSVALLATVTSDSAEPVPQNTFGWRVLTTLTDSVDTWISPDDNTDANEVHIRISKAVGTATHG